MKTFWLLVTLALVLGSGVALIACEQSDDDDDNKTTSDDDDDDNDNDSGDFNCDSEVCTDIMTGLIWQLGEKCGLSQEEAKKNCDSLTLDGSSDWRLPTISELRTLVRGCAATEDGGSCGVTDSCLDNSKCRNGDCDGCANQQGPGPDGHYWPDEFGGGDWWFWSYSFVTDVSGNSWYLGFDNAIVNNSDYKDKYCGRCVR